MDQLDTITLTGLRVRGHHGVYQEERREGQTFVVDAELRLSTRTAAASDDVVDTVHYGELAERIAAVVAGEPVNLLERLAQRIADVVLGEPRVERVTITVHKPEAPISVPFADVAVTIERGRA